MLVLNLSLSIFSIVTSSYLISCGLFSIYKK
ncbi:uncharacterized protein DC041_0007141 [Schistosoma bovis]|uniref:Uncharacterized protein n=1 Tax=Schistosoma bovis TaxID=6184 RepID=A0A430QS15_SCHBO|nr:uncharacterized protein DC041_0007141 [Schistosoma bovis]